MFNTACVYVPYRVKYWSCCTGILVLHTHGIVGLYMFHLIQLEYITSPYVTTGHDWYIIYSDKYKDHITCVNGQSCIL